MPGTLLLPSAGGSRQRGRIPHTRHGFCAGCDLYTPQPDKGTVPCLGCGGGYAVVLDSGPERDEHARLQRAVTRGHITDLRVHPPYVLLVNGIKVGDFAPDFTYCEADGTLVIEEVKSAYTVKDPYYQLRKRVFQACYGLRVQEIIG